MKAYRIKKKVGSRGTLELRALPFQEGEPVEIIILKQEDKPKNPPLISLQGKVLEYIDPTEPVGANDWDALK